MRSTIDLHEMTVLEAKLALNHLLDSLSFRYDEVLVVHGYHGHVLMDYVRNEYEHRRIKQKKNTLNPGDTMLLLKSREEYESNTLKPEKRSRKYFASSDELGLDHWQKKDLSLAKRIWLNRDICRYVTSDGVFSNDQINGWLLKEIETQDKFWMQYWPVFNNGRFIGCCGFHPEEVYREVEMDFQFIEKQPEIKKKALQTALAFGRDQLGLKKVTAYVHPEDEERKALLEELGFRLEGDKMFKTTARYHFRFVFFLK